MILLDATVFMYAAGTGHPNKAPAVTFLKRVMAREVDAAIDAETLQEILHRCRAIRRWEDGRRVYDLARTLVPFVLPVTAPIVDEARDLLDRYPDLMARDALHASVALEHTAGEICSFDTDFDEIDGVKRTEPRVEDDGPEGDGEAPEPGAEE